MPYRRRGYRVRRRRIRRKSGGGTWGTVGKIASTALKIGKFVKSVINPEFKWWDYEGTFSSITANGTGVVDCNCMTLITQGTGSQQRIGQSILMKSINFRISLNVNPAVGGGGNTHVRCIVFADTRTLAQSSLPIDNVLELGTNYLSPLDMDYPGRYKVFYDKIIDLGYSNETRTLHFRKDYTEADKQIQHLKWDQTGNGESDVRQNHIYLLLISDQSTNTPNANVYCRFRFIDN